jgi:beta-aspartyl-peptidase (threonine type)
MQPSIIVHGGTWQIPPDEQAPHTQGPRRAAEAGWAVLAAGGSAMDAVEAAIVVMEDDETFDAGRGSYLNADGQVELDAGCMNGADLQVGAVASVQFIRNPIRLARTVMDRSEHVLLVGQGAQRFAHRMGFSPCELTDLAVPREFERWQKLLYDRTYSARSSVCPQRPGFAGWRLRHCRLCGSGCRWPRGGRHVDGGDPQQDAGPGGRRADGGLWLLR